jgi:hypothetical protein
MAAITWKNVNNDVDTRGLAMLSNSGIENVNAGFEGLTNIITDRQEEGIARGEQQKENNTNAYFDKLEAMSLDELDTSIELGRFAELDDEFGNMINRSEIRGAGQDRLVELQGQKTASDAYDMAELKKTHRGLLDNLDSLKYTDLDAYTKGVEEHRGVLGELGVLSQYVQGGYAERRAAADRGYAETERQRTESAYQDKVKMSEILDSVYSNPENFDKTEAEMQNIVRGLGVEAGLETAGSLNNLVSQNQQRWQLNRALSATERATHTRMVGAATLAANQQTQDAESLLATTLAQDPNYKHQDNYEVFDVRANDSTINEAVREMGWDADAFEADWTENADTHNEEIATKVNLEIVEKNKTLGPDDQLLPMKKDDPRIQNLIAAALQGGRNADKNPILSSIVNYEENRDSGALIDAAVSQFERLAHFERTNKARSVLSGSTAELTTKIQNDVDNYALQTERDMIKSKAYLGYMPPPNN